MIYIIDENITYNPHDCTLSHIDTGEEIKLSITSGRLLEKFLESQGDILSRDILLKEVWDIYGLRGSNNNLNQYVSLIRRAATDFGCNNLIITIPKVGFKLNPEINICRKKIGIVNNEQMSNPLHSSKTLKDSLWIIVYYTRPMLLLFVLFAVISYAILYSFISHDFTNKDISPISMMLPGGCEIISLKKTDESEKQVMIKNALSSLTDNGIKCSNNGRVYFISYTSFTTKDLGRTMVAYCKTNNERRIISCDNFYYKEWRSI